MKVQITYFMNGGILLTFQIHQFLAQHSVKGQDIPYSKEKDHREMGAKSWKNPNPDIWTQSSWTDYSKRLSIMGLLIDVLWDYTNRSIVQWMVEGLSRRGAAKKKHKINLPQDHHHAHSLSDHAITSCKETKL